MRVFSGLQIFLLAKTLSVIGAVDFTVFSNSQVVTTGFTIYWSLGTDNITFGLNASTGGNWAGIGIAEPTSGSMPGADMAVLDIFNGAVRLQDYWASAKAYPNLDDCQSWYLNSSALSNGNVEAIFTRKINNSDTQDRAINTTAGYSTRMVWAYGTTTSLSYHNANRGPFALFLAGGADPVANSSWSTVDLNMTNYAVPAVYTTYACNSFFLPNSTTYYIKRFEFLNAHQVVKSQVHHIVVYTCSSASSPGFTQYFGNPQACNFSIACQDVIYVWAPGQDVFQLPDGVSFEMGATGAAYAVIQVHYTNPSIVTGESDSSGVRIFYDTVPTTNLAGVLETGDAFIFAPALPANTAEIHYEFSCPTMCTAPISTNLTFFGSFLHMHGTGTMMYSTITSNATGVTSAMNRIEFYDYGFQQITPINMVLSPGDHMNTHCIYSTTGYSSPVTFGLATTNEMCIQFAFYYPKVDASACTYYPFYVYPNTTYCGYGNTLSGVQDPYTRDNSALLTKQFGLVQSQCPAGAAALTAAPTTAPTSKAAISAKASMVALIVTLGFCMFIF